MKARTLEKIGNFIISATFAAGVGSAGAAIFSAKCDPELREQYNRVSLCTRADAPDWCPDGAARNAVDENNLQMAEGLGMAALAASVQTLIFLSRSAEKPSPLDPKSRLR
jgi:hypothetical protein